LGEEVAMTLSERARLEKFSSALAGQQCRQRSCTGTLVEAEYKGNQAIVCAACGIPLVQLW